MMAFSILLFSKMYINGFGEAFLLWMFVLKILSPADISTHKGSLLSFLAGHSKLHPLPVSSDPPGIF